MADSHSHFDPKQHSTPLTECSKSSDELQLQYNKDPQKSTREHLPASPPLFPLARPCSHLSLRLLNLENFLSHLQFARFPDLIAIVPIEEPKSSASQVGDVIEHLPSQQRAHDVHADHGPDTQTDGDGEHGEKDEAVHYRENGGGHEPCGSFGKRPRLSSPLTIPVLRGTQWQS
jgi:hypothetical protein